MAILDNLAKGERLHILLAAMALIGSIVLVLAIFSYFSTENMLTEQLMQNQLTNTKHITSKVEAAVMQARDELITLSKFPIIDGVSSGKCAGLDIITGKKEDLAISMGNSGITSIARDILKADSTGTIVECSSGGLGDYVGLNIKNKDYFKIPAETKGPFVGFEHGIGKNIVISAPLFETTEYTPYPNFIGKFNGVLLTLLDVNELYDVHIYPSLEKAGSLFFLINPADSNIILSSRGLNNDEVINETLQASYEAGIIDINGIGKSIATRSDLYFGSEHWKLVVLTPLENAGKKFWPAQSKNLLNLVLIFVLVMGVVFLLLHIPKNNAKPAAKKASMNLNELGIKIETEQDRYTQADMVLEPKHVYLIKEDNENNTHELFIRCLNNGYAGLGFIREKPADFKAKYNLQKTSFVWLTKSKAAGILCESDIDNVYLMISEFARQSKKSVVLIDRLDYIIAENSFDDVVRNMHMLQDLVLNNSCIVILSLNPGMVEASKLKAIESDSIDLYGRSLKDKIELSSFEFEILNFVNENNIKNKLVAYKDITEKIGVTKPTTRAKLNRLLALGLLNIDKRGRFKSIKITSSGRKLIG